MAGIQDAGKLYGGYLQNAQQAVGFNPQQLTQANNNLTAMQNIVAAAPTQAQNAGNYYGTTSGGTNNIYSGMMSNLAPGLTNATNTAGNMTNEYQTLATQANQQAGLTQQSQQAKASAATNVYQTSVQQMSTAGQTMSTIEGLAQQQGYLTAEQTTAYQNAYSNYVTAQASATSAAAAASIAPSTIAANTATANLNNAQTAAQVAANQATAAANKKIAGTSYTTMPNGSGGVNYFANGQPITNSQYAQATGVNTSQLEKQVASGYVAPSTHSIGARE